MSEETEFTCAECGQVFKLPPEATDAVTCPKCETEYDLVEEPPPVPPPALATNELHVAAKQRRASRRGCLIAVGVAVAVVAGLIAMGYLMSGGWRALTCRGRFPSPSRTTALLGEHGYHPLTAEGTQTTVWSRRVLTRTFSQDAMAWDALTVDVLYSLDGERVIGVKVVAEALREQELQRQELGALLESLQRKRHGEEVVRIFAGFGRSFADREFVPGERPGETLAAARHRQFQVVCIQNDLSAVPGGELKWRRIWLMLDRDY